MPLLHHGGTEPSAIWVTLIIVLTALLYLRGWLHLRSTTTTLVAPWHAVCFLVGLFLVWAAVASPISVLDHELLTVHMLQHLLLMTFAPLAIWLGAPAMPLLHGLPQRFAHEIMLPLLRSRTMRQVGSFLAHPVFCWLAASVALVGWHIPSLFALGMQSGWWHFAEHASFLAAGLLFWWPVIQPWPSVAKWHEAMMILYLFLATLPCDILSAFLVFCDRVVYPVYFSASRPFGFSALADQQCAGALMWTCVTMVYLVVGAIITVRLLSRRSTSETELAHSEFRIPDAPKALLRLKSL